MPNARFYVRNHFQIPTLDEATFRPAVHGLVERPLRVSLRDLMNWPTQTRIVTLECAGNGRALFHPPIDGEKWHKYWFEWIRESKIVREPVSLQRVRSVITEPGPGREVSRGELMIRGVAWSGAAPIGRVEVSSDGSGAEWQEARLVGERQRYSWQWWELITRIERTGDITLRARATDMAGRTQPEQAEWNRLGYGNNAVHQLTVRVIDCTEPT